MMMDGIDSGKNEIRGSIPSQSCEEIISGYIFLDAEEWFLRERVKYYSPVPLDAAGGKNSEGDRESEGWD